MPYAAEIRAEGDSAEPAGTPGSEAATPAASAAAAVDDHLDPGGKAARVRSMFSDIAPTYDLLNTILSLGVDARWRRQAVSAALHSEAVRAALSAGRAPTVLDVATGTGKLAMSLKRTSKRASVTGVDFAEPMLAVAREAAARQGHEIAFEQGDGSALAFEDASFDALTIAYGLRNFADPLAGLAEFRRVLRPGGRLVVLEFPPPREDLFGRLYSAYFDHLLPRIGAAVSGQRAAYSYLPQSVHGFMAPQELKDSLLAAGFARVEFQLQTLGISALHVADVPANTTSQASEHDLAGHDARLDKRREPHG